MAKYLVETYYNCTFKVSHYLDEINDTELKKLEKRDDGKFEIIDVKLDNRKTKNLDKASKVAEINKKDENKIDLISEILLNLSRFLVFLLSSLTSIISILPSSLFSKFLSSLSLISSK